MKNYLLVIVIVMICSKCNSDKDILEFYNKRKECKECYEKQRTCEIYKKKKRSCKECSGSAFCEQLR